VSEVVSGVDVLTSEDRATVDEHRQIPAALSERFGPKDLAVAVVGPVAVAVVVLPFRDQIRTPNVALVLVLAVLVAAIVGGRLGGAIAAVVAAGSFDFLFTRPYYSLSINNGDDVQTFVLLLAVGLVVGEIVARSRRSYAVARRSRREAEHLRRLAELAAGGESAGRLVAVVQNELTTILDLKSVRFERPPFRSALPQLRHRGVRVDVGAPDDHALKSQLELPVRGGGRLVGRFVLTMAADGSGIQLPAESRALAVALADQLGAALVRSGEGNE
jgi:K+-sensing histidine kinase KdpD